MSANSHAEARRSGLSEAAYFLHRLDHGMLRHGGSVSFDVVTCLNMCLAQRSNFQHVASCSTNDISPVVLRELGLAVGAQVFVAGLAHDLEIFVAAAATVSSCRVMRRHAGALGTGLGDMRLGAATEVAGPLGRELKPDKGSRLENPSSQRKRQIS